MKWMAIRPPPVRWSSVAAIRASSTGWTKPGRWATSTFRVLGAVEHGGGDGPALRGHRPVADQHPIEPAVVVGPGDVDQVAGIDDGPVHPVDDGAVDQRPLDLRGVPGAHHPDDLDRHAPWFLHPDGRRRIQCIPTNPRPSFRRTTSSTLTSGRWSGARRRRRPATGDRWSPWATGPAACRSCSWPRRPPGVCDLLWMIDGSVAEMGQMAELLNRFGPVVDIGGLGVEQPARGVGPASRPTPSPPTSTPTWSHYAEVAERAGPAVPLRRDRRSPSPTSRDSAGSWPTPGCPCPPARSSGPTSRAGSLTAIESRGGLAGRPEAPVGPGEPVHLPGPRPRRTWTGCSRPWARTARRWSSRATWPTIPARADGPYAAYVSVESVAAAGVISHLALTGRFPLAENFRETGFFIPAALDDADQDGGAATGHRGDRGPRRAAPAACTPRSSSPRTAPGSSRSTAGWAAACPRCSTGPPACPSSS